MFLNWDSYQRASLFLLPSSPCLFPYSSCHLIPPGSSRLIFNGFLLDIADVTNFLHPGSPLDDEAAQRGTLVYLVERQIDMLPKPLTEGNIIFLSWLLQWITIF